MAPRHNTTAGCAIGRFTGFAPHPMSRFWSAVVNGLTPYVPGEQPQISGLVKLNTNEHPYGPSPLVLEAIRNSTHDDLRLYPDPNATDLKAALAQRHGVQASQVFVGNGSDEVLAHAFLALLKQDQALWFPDVTYSFYPVYCSLYGVAHRCIALDDSLSIRVEDYLPNGTERAGAIIVANPNAPTGKLLTLSEIERLVASNPDIPVIIDEAYVDFGGESAIALVNTYPNLLVVHTFSKSRSLAGLRVGYAVGHADLIEGLERVKNSFNSYPLDKLALAGAIASVQDEAYFQQACQRVVRTRESLTADLHALGFEVLPSAANFVFARHPSHEGAALAQALRERAILVRHFPKPRIQDYLRITIGTEAQCQQLTAALRDITAIRASQP